MARPRKVAVAPVEEPPAPVPAPAGEDTPIRRRRRRRTVTTPPDYAAETATIVDAVLKGRGAKGATGELLGTVVAWARGIRLEGDALKELNSKPRRAKTQAPIARITDYEKNRALLDGILSGTVALDVQEDGTLVFLNASSLTTAAPAPADTAVVED